MNTRDESIEDLRHQVLELERLQLISARVITSQAFALVETLTSKSPHSRATPDVAGLDLKKLADMPVNDLAKHLAANST